MARKYTLPKDFSDKWLEALRSGKYEQVDRKLFYKGKYCCIGVAGSICGVPESEMDDKGLFSKISYHHLDDKRIVKKLYGSADDNPLVKKLINMNDAGVSFVEIANWVEKNTEPK